MSRGTLDATIASGNLGVIRDLQLRDMLVVWRAQVEDASEQAQGMLDASGRSLLRIAMLGGPWGRAPSERFARFPSLVERSHRTGRPDPMVIRNDPELMALGRFMRRTALVYPMELM